MIHASKVPLKEGAENRSYYKYYLRDMAEIPVEKKEFLKNPKGDPKDALKIRDQTACSDPGF